MTNLVQINWSAAGRNMPFCTKCGRSVDMVECEYVIELMSRYPYPRYDHTGEIILAIRCHGEVFEISNWRGVLSA